MGLSALPTKLEAQIIIDNIIDYYYWFKTEDIVHINDIKIINSNLFNFNSMVHTSIFHTI